jgi:hypothetical protein
MQTANATQAPATIDLNQLTPEQLTIVRKQLREAAKANGATLEQRNSIIDKMLQERDGAEFKHTTANILEALQAAKCVPATLDKHDRTEWLKKIQTRKQLLETKPEFKGKVGYKASGGFGAALTADRVIDWLMTEGNTAKLTPADRKAILKAIGQ